MIATLGLISSSTAVVIGAMIIAPLMDPILSLAFGLAVSDGKLIRRSAVTIGFGVLAVVGTASLLSWGLGISHVQSEITGRTSPNMIDLGIAIAAAVAGSFSMTRKQLSNSIAGWRLLSPLCHRSVSAALASRSARKWWLCLAVERWRVSPTRSRRGRFCFLANLIGITVTSLVVFLLQRYGSFRSCWRNLLLWLGLLGLLSLPLSSALHDFKVRQEMNAEFDRFRSGQLKRVAIAQNNPRFWSRVRLMYSSVSVVNNKARLDLVLNAPENFLDQSVLDDFHQQILKQPRILAWIILM